MKPLNLPAVEWHTAGNLSAGDYTKIRKPMHHAVQLASVPGRYLLAPRDDDGHTNLGWEDSLGALSGRGLNDKNLRVALQIDSPELLVVEDLDRIVHALALGGKTLTECFDWMQKQLEKQGCNTVGLSMELDYSAELPDHPFAGNDAFPSLGKKLGQELAQQFTNAGRILEGVREQFTALASEVRCWPHHFDIATLISFDQADSQQKLESIGVGFSPGDDKSAMPYYYVTPWPYPDTSRLNLPDLPSGGRWHTEGWLGASQTIDHSNTGQGAAVIDFLQSAFNFLLTLK